MNVNIPKQVCPLLFWLFVIPLLPKAQDTITINLTTYVNQVVDHPTVCYPPFKPRLEGNNGANGIAKYEEAPTSPIDFNIIYTPNEGFSGVDSFLYRVYPYPGSPIVRFEKYIVTVEPSEVTANPDIVTTNVNQPISIDALFNDIGSYGDLNIQNIALVNNGDAILDQNNGIIQFTPEVDFSGIAYLTYNVCDDLGTCDLGTVSINVIDNTPSDDTLRIFTKKNEAQIILTPNDLPLTIPPLDGIYDASTNEYVPDNDFIGSDEFVLQQGDQKITVLVDVLDFESPNFAIDDKVYTTPFAPLEFNVLDNDNSSSCFQIESQPGNGTIESGFPFGTITYFPR